MFWEFFKFEMRFRMKSISTYVYFLIWLTFSFLCVASESFGPVGSTNGKVLLNGPFANSLNDFGASLQVSLMHGVNHLGLRQVELVVGTVDKDSVRVEQGSHGAVTEHRRLAEPRKKVRGHIVSRIQDEGGFCIPRWRLAPGVKNDGGGAK